MKMKLMNFVVMSGIYDDVERNVKRVVNKKVDNLVWKEVVMRVFEVMWDIDNSIKYNIKNIVNKRVDKRVIYV